MISYKDYSKLTEASDNTKLQEIKLNIAKKFDDITEAKKLKKPGDRNSEILSVDKQAAIYLEISGLMKMLSGEMRKPTVTKPSTDTY
jgi:hypothetical protein